MTEMLRMLISSRMSLLAVVLLTLSLVGCDDSASEASGTLTGTVKSGGEVCGDCTIAIFNPETLLRRGCIVGESGEFELKEIPFGDYEVTVGQKPTNSPDPVFDKRIPKKYRSKKTSGLSVSITSAEPVVFNIEMN